MNLKTFWANRWTTIPGMMFLLSWYLTINPDALKDLIDPAISKKITGWAGIVFGFVTFATSKAGTVSGNGSIPNPIAVANSDGTQTIQPAAPTPSVLSQSKL